MQIISETCEQCGYQKGTVYFNFTNQIKNIPNAFPIICTCNKLKCNICKKNNGRYPNVFFLKSKKDSIEYVYKTLEFLCTNCADKKKDVKLTGDHELDYALTFLATAYHLQNQNIAIYIIMYLSSHGLELLFKYFLTKSNINPASFNHNIKKLYKKLKNTCPQLPRNDILVKKIHKNLQSGGIRFFQPNVQYQKTTPIEVIEYASILIQWWQNGQVPQKTTLRRLLKIINKIFKLKNST